MAEFPALMLWTDAYLGDAYHLTTEEHGAYFLLIMACWRTPDCRLPDDDAFLARVTKIRVDRWKRRFRPVMEQFWTIAGGFWTQKRLSAERQKVAVISANRREVALKGVRAKALKRKNSGQAIAEPKVNHPEPHPLSKEESSTDSETLYHSSEREGGSGGGIPPPTLAVVNGTHSHVPSPQAAPAAPDPHPRKRVDQGTRLDPDWEPGADGIAFARQYGFHAEAINRMFDDFQDTFLAKAGAAARKTSWPRAWKRWVKTEHDRVQEKERRDQRFRERYQVAARR